MNETAPSSPGPLCFSRLERPPIVHVDCLAGSLVLHASLTSEARVATLHLSSGRLVTSAALALPARDGAIRRGYYQVLRGSGPIPVELTEVDGAGRRIGALRAERVPGCTRTLIHVARAGVRRIARIRAQNNAELTFTYVPYRILGTGGFEIVVRDLSSHSAVVGSGALRPEPPFEWEVRHLCEAHPYWLLYGLAPRGATVAIDATRAHTSSAPRAVGSRRVFFYRAQSRAPSRISVVTAAGLDRSVDTTDVVRETPCS